MECPPWLPHLPPHSALLFRSHGSGVFFSLVFLLKLSSPMSRPEINTWMEYVCSIFEPGELSAKPLTNRLAWNGPMLLKIMSKHRGSSPPSPGEPVMVCVFPLPVTPYVKRRPRRDRRGTASREGLRSSTTRANNAWEIKPYRLTSVVSLEVASQHFLLKKSFSSLWWAKRLTLTHNMHITREAKSLKSRKRQEELPRMVSGEPLSLQTSYM